jgi:YVTN family beta-propeller protein
MLRRISLLVAVLTLVAGLLTAPRLLTSRPTGGDDYTHFESAHVHPAVMTPSGDRLLVVNTPGSTLVVFDLTGEGITRIAEIPVGLDPVSVAALDDSTAWVVNHLSDDVSVVDLTLKHVRATIQVGDEPNDVVFAGAGRAYVSVSQEDAIKVYDTATLALVTTIPVLGRMPRSLARTADGSKVYTAIFHAGNRTSVLTAAEVADSIPDDLDFPRDPSNKLGHPAPAVGGIIQLQLNDWRDEYGKLWNSKAKYTLPDNDVVEISTSTNTVTRSFTGLGSINYNIAVNPVDDRIANVSTEARNTLRYEPKIVGYMVDTRVNFINQAGTITPRILNPHINYTVVPGTQAEHDSAIGIPTSIAFSSNGLRAYVTSFANDRIAVLNPAAGGSASMMRLRHPTIAEPTQVVVDDARNRLYVVGRARNQVQVLRSDDFTSVAVEPVGYDPTPDAIVHGRRFLYGGFTSAHGDQSCATCHIFGDMDNLAWDLGDPLGPYLPGDAPLDGFDPQKGPMMTQTLRGMLNTEPLHWRGDRVNFGAFNGAFVSLMGRASSLPDSQMTAFTDFVQAIKYPPNPHQRLDRSFVDAPMGTPSAVRGQTFFMNTPVVGTQTCNDCHSAAAFAPGTNRQLIPNETLLQSQDLKVPQLRNLYRKTGFEDAAGAVSKRGFGYGHDGSIDDIVDFLESPQFTGFSSDTAIANADRRDLKAFLLAFDTGTAPAVGAQVTFGADLPAPEALLRVDTMKAQADLDHCDLVAKGRVDGIPRGWEYVGSDSWAADRASEPTLTTAALVALAGLGTELTITGVPQGSGHRMGVDRDRDLALDGDEVVAGSDPSSPLSTPENVGVASRTGPVFGLRALRPSPFRDRVEMTFALERAQKVDLVVLDVLGRETRSLVRGGLFQAGEHRLTWDGRRSDGGSAGAGVYFVQLRTESGRSVRPVIRIR